MQNVEVGKFSPKISSKWQAGAYINRGKNAAGCKCWKYEMRTENRGKTRSTGGKRARTWNQRQAGENS